MSADQSPNNPGHLLNEFQAAEYLNVTVHALRAWRLRGGGPVYSKLGRSVRYRLADLEAFVAGNLTRHTSDAGDHEQT